MTTSTPPATGLTLYAHPFSSYCWKVLIAMFADDTEFTYRNIDPSNPEAMDELLALWPLGKFPLLVDNGEVIAETTSIIEHLQARHPGPNLWIPEGAEGRRVRFLDRFFDNYVMSAMQASVNHALRPEGHGDAFGAEQGIKLLRTAYDWLEANLPDSAWAAGDRFTLADCAAAPSLFYADWVDRIGQGRPRLNAYRARLLAHSAVSRAVEEARPYRAYFPLGAPDRD
ncbi:MAG: glutathione S-transferase family protein [Sphingomicrobium sp.]